MEGRLSQFFDYWKSYVADANNGVKYLFYGDVRSKIGALASVAKYPMLVLAQPEVTSRHTGSGFANHFAIELAIVDKHPNKGVNDYMRVSGLMFDLIGKMEAKVKADFKDNAFGTRDLKFRLNEVDEILLTGHIGWMAEFELILPCGSWGRI